MPPGRSLELVLDLSCSVSSLPQVTAVRGSVILASLHALRQLDLFDSYRACLPEPQAKDVLGVTAGAWLTLDLAHAHYRACDQLQLTPSLQYEVGLCAGRRAIGTMLGTAMRLSRLAGATPWTLIKGGDRIWNRAYEGGGMRIFRGGESDALIEAHKNSLMVELEFCRNSFRGFCVALYGLVSERMSVRVLSVGRDEVRYRAVWK